MRARLLSAPEECRRKVHPAQVKSRDFCIAMRSGLPEKRPTHPQQEECRTHKWPPESIEN